MGRKLLYAIVLILAFICVFASCDSNDDGTPNTPENDTHIHTFGTWEITKAPTCTKEGIKEQYCSCGQKQTQTIPTSDHIFGVWHIIKEATCTVNGLKERTCSCGEKKTETIIASHAWEDATCTKAEKCSKCGLTNGTALGHTCSIGTCDRCNIKVYPTVILPSVPMIVSYRSNGTIKITELSYEFDSSGDLIISFSGEVTYTKGYGYVGFLFKVFDENGYVVCTDGWIDSGYSTGDKFKNRTLKVYSSKLNGASEYTIVITDHN